MIDHLSDAILLERFVRRREEAAFAVLMRRHGPLVEGTCRRVLRDERDVEDVLQATFLVLARKAARIAWRDSVASWLCAVAHRLALGIRAETSRQRRRETSITRWADGESRHADFDGPAERWQAPDDPVEEAQRRDLRRLLDEELALLPEKYRAPVILCFLEGRTHEDAARELGWPAGSMSRRLERARSLLRRRLVYRGVTLAIGLLAATVAFKSGALATRPVQPWSEIVVGHAAIGQSPRSTGSDFGRNSSADRSAAGTKAMTALACQATVAADAMSRQDPGANQDQWRRLIDEMRGSAAKLAGAAAQNDSAAMLLSARRLESSCVGCHNVFQHRAKPLAGDDLVEPAG